MIVLPVAHQDVQQLWPQVSEYLSKALVFSGDYEPSQVKVYLAKGLWQLLVVVDEDSNIKGALTVEYISRPNHRVAFVTAVGGRAITSQETFDSLVDVLKHNGATKIEGAVRESVARLWKRNFGATEKYTITEVEL